MILSYIKNCKVCGQRISLREMQRGQWVAFDVNTDIPHKHNKKNKAQKRPSYSYENPPQNEKINYQNTPNFEEKKSNIWPYVIIGIIILIIIYY